MAGVEIEFRFVLGSWRLEHLEGPLPEGKRLVALALLAAMQCHLLAQAMGGVTDG